MPDPLGPRPRRSLAGAPRTRPVAKRPLPAGWVLAIALAAAPAAAGPRGLGPGAIPLEAVALLELPAPDLAPTLAEDARRDTLGLPYRFAVPREVAADPDSSGTWESLPDGTALWRLRIASRGARSLNLGFTTFRMPEGARLFLYTPDGRVVVGPFDAADNESHGQLWTPALPGAEIVVEIAADPAAAAEVQLALGAVNHGYRGFFATSTERGSGSCNVDVVCPEGDDWRNEIRSVARIQRSGFLLCSGFLVNNTAQDFTPYFMTADHCGVTSGNAASVVVYWNFENSTCRPTGSPEAGGPGDGSLSQFNSGAIFRAAGSASDFTLVELDDPIAPDVGAFFAGWDATAADAFSAVAIHHPSNDEKRISFELDPTTTTSYLEASSPGDGTHVRVADWDVGTTEGGSSGSPLFDQDHRVIGQLHGGFAACGNDSADWYGRFDVSFTGGGTPSTRLSDWLDPGNTGATVLDGAEPFLFIDGFESGDLSAWGVPAP